MELRERVMGAMHRIEQNRTAAKWNTPALICVISLVCNVYLVVHQSANAAASATPVKPVEQCR